MDVESTKNCDRSGFGKSPTKLESSKAKWEGCRGVEKGERGTVKRKSGSPQGLGGLEAKTTPSGGAAGPPPVGYVTRGELLDLVVPWFCQM